MKRRLFELVASFYACHPRDRRLHLVARRRALEAVMGRDIRCFHPDALPITAECRWPAGTPASWYLDESTVPETARSFVDLSLHAATGIWSQSSGIQTPRVFDPSLARVLISFVPIDGAWNVLGITQLPCGASSVDQCTMHLDAAEAWTPDMLAQVAAHEFGHGIGLGHSTGTALMAPIWNNRIYTLQPSDLLQVQGRYGPPAYLPPLQ